MTPLKGLPIKEIKVFFKNSDNGIKRQMVMGAKKEVMKQKASQP